MYRPAVVRASTMASRTTAITMIQVEVFTDRKEVRARSPKDGWLYRMIRLPPVTRLARPATTNDIASVAISELIRKNVVTTPFTSPTTSPTASPARIATAGGADSARWAAVTPASA